MTVWHDLDAVPADLGRTVVTIGNFDGVHRGHRAILDRAARAADALGAHVPVVVVTFDPHPMAVLAPERVPPLLTTVQQRVRLLSDCGADVLVLTFDRSLAAWTPQEFVRRLLVDTLHAAAVVVGANFRFGVRASGDVATLRALGPGLGFTVDDLDLVGGDPPWSSTVVRRALAGGDVEAAADVLGRPHSVDGVVVEGEHRGAGLGYPTANIPASGMLVVPGDGVFAGTMQRLDEPGAPVWPAAISVGTNPTFGAVDRRVEAYVLDRDDLELYDVPVRVAFHAHLRAQVRFDGIDALVRQMADDVGRTRARMGHPADERTP